MAQLIERTRVNSDSNKVVIRDVDIERQHLLRLSYMLCIDNTEIYISHKELTDLGKQIDQILKSRKAVVDVEV